MPAELPAARDAGRAGDATPAGPPDPHDWTAAFQPFLCEVVFEPKPMPRTGSGTTRKPALQRAASGIRATEAAVPAAAQPLGPNPLFELAEHFVHAVRGNFEIRGSGHTLPILRIKVQSDASIPEPHRARLLEWLKARASEVSRIVDERPTETALAFLVLDMLKYMSFSGAAATAVVPAGSAVQQELPAAKWTRPRLGSAPGSAGASPMMTQATPGGQPPALALAGLAQHAVCPTVDEDADPVLASIRRSRSAAGRAEPAPLSPPGPGRGRQEQLEATPGLAEERVEAFEESEHTSLGTPAGSTSAEGSPPQAPQPQLPAPPSAPRAVVPPLRLPLRSDDDPAPAPAPCAELAAGAPPAAAAAGGGAGFGATATPRTPVEEACTPRSQHSGPPSSRRSANLPQWPPAPRSDGPSSAPATPALPSAPAPADLPTPAPLSGAASAPAAAAAAVAGQPMPPGRKRGAPDVGGSPAASPRSLESRIPVPQHHLPRHIASTAVPARTSSSPPAPSPEQQPATPPAAPGTRLLRRPAGAGAVSSSPTRRGSAGQAPPSSGLPRAQQLSPRKAPRIGSGGLHAASSAPSPGSVVAAAHKGGPKPGHQHTHSVTSVSSQGSQGSAGRPDAASGTPSRAPNWIMGHTVSSAAKLRVPMAGPGTASPAQPFPFASSSPGGEAHEENSPRRASAAVPHSSSFPARPRHSPSKGTSPPSGIPQPSRAHGHGQAAAAAPPPASPPRPTPSAHASSSLSGGLQAMLAGTPFAADLRTPRSAQRAAAPPPFRP